MSAVQDRVGSLMRWWAFTPWRPGIGAQNRSYWEGMRERERFGGLPPEEQDRRTLETLQAIVAHARDHVPYYDRLLRGYPAGFPATLEEYRSLPVLTKEILRSEQTELISRRADRRRLRRNASGGSTGKPVTIFMSREDIGWKVSGHQHFQTILGCPFGSRTGTLYGGELEVQAKPTLRTRIMQWLANQAPHGCFRLDDEYLLQVHHRLQRQVPALFLAYASAVHQLALLLEKRGLRPAYPTRVILTGGEKLTDSQRRIVEGVFGVPAIERYGAREIGLMGYQLPGGDRGFRIDRTYCLLEPEGEPDAKRTAPLLVTALRRWAMPLLRYRIGDLARFPDEWSEGRSLRRLEEVTGRVLDYIHLPGGRMVHSAEFPHLLKDADIIAFQVVQQKDASVDVHLLAGDGHDSARQEHVQRIIRENLSGVEVRFSYVDRLRRTRGHEKLRPVVSHYKPAESP